MGYRPLPKEDNIESSLIWYKNGDVDSMSHWVDSLTEFMKPYTDEATKERKGTKYVVCSDTTELKEGEECQFTDMWLEGNCTSAQSWGYASESPCIILKMNKMFGWVPEPYETIAELPEDMPESLKTHISDQVAASSNVMPKRIWVSCVGENPSDEEYLGDLKYSPWQGFPSYYFPFKNTPGYTAPVVAVEFQNTKPNVLINVECRAWAKNIKYDRGNRFGLVSFQLIID
ncbi:LOW QUALITY PROTEIN: sodium/potassium-transporting ATPase subunit beta-2-like [Palaemon carinicauda]|uniref:LOW QUALITY PROTEIN: sodium/potassium-transporting ATPase subunit beta-2-like n=1 Tax=Palaemon carinicauda TaxID=392227 RepID=UPI0035B5DA9A